MIERYTRAPMAAVWSERARYEHWWKVELAFLEARADRGELAPETVDTIRTRAGFDIDDIHRIESEVQHDVIAFLTSVAKHVGPESRFIHQGLTSSDVVDTAFALQIRDAAALISGDLAALRVILRRLALEHRRTPAVGRTHGMHAELTVFGLKFALWDDEFARHEQRLEQVLERVVVGKLSGAVGNYGHTNPSIEEAVMGRLGIGVAPISTQVVGRERHAEMLNLLALIGGSIEKIATEIRHLQRTEVGEAYEPFGRMQKGSSAMPHKRNPILCERLCGMARLLRGYALTGMENIALWHERDISHSSAERVIFPDAFIAADYMLHVLIRVLDGLDVKPARLQRNIDLSRGMLNSEKFLLALTDAGWTRERAYDHIRAAAMSVYDSERSFLDAIKADDDVVAALGLENIEALGTGAPRYDMADEIYTRLGLLG